MDNEYLIGNNQVIVRIPDLPGRITRKKVKDEYGKERFYIELILDRFYDAEKHQSRNKRVGIGIDISHLYEGMMLPSKKYYQYFRHNGTPIYGPGFPETIQGTKNQRKEQTQGPAAEETTEQTSEQTTEQTTEPTPKQLTSQRRDVALTAKGQTETDAQEPEEEESEEQQTQRTKDRIRFLKNLLMMYQHSVDTIAIKRPNTVMSAYKIERINELLQERAVLMTDNGFPMDYMDVKYRCDVCRDTGFTDTGEKCSCYEERAREASVWEGRS